MQVLCIAESYAGRGGLTGGMYSYPTQSISGANMVFTFVREEKGKAYEVSAN